MSDEAIAKAAREIIRGVHARWESIVAMSQRDALAALQGEPWVVWRYVLRRWQGKQP